MKRQRAANDRRDRGSVAVEFALLLPVLLLLIFGIIDFGRAINAQITVTQAAREGARLASFGDSSSVVTAGTKAAAAPNVTLTTANITVTTCAVPASGADAVVTVSYPFTFVTPVGAFASMFGTASFGSTTLTITAKGDIPCET